MFKIGNKILTFLTFFGPFILYINTMAPTTSFWDCGEFIATSYILGVPHPPGAPLFLLLGNFFSHIPIFQDIGARVNLISPIASAFSVMFLYLIIVHLIEEFNGKSKDLSSFIMNNVSAFIAALTFAVTDSHWFNAVESEVYGLSTFFTAIVIWMILKWSKNSDNKWDIRYLLIIAYMIGLAIGIHILNLLALPFIALIIYFKKYDFSYKGFFLTVILTVISFILIYYGIILGLPDIVSKFNGINIIIFIISLLFLSILFLHLNKNSTSFSNISKILSILSIIFIFLISYNKLFIDDISSIENSYDNQIRIIDDTFYYFLSEKDGGPESFLPSDYEYVETLKKDRAVLLRNQELFNSKKDSIGFFGLIFWQSNFVILGFLTLFIGVPILGYLILWKKENNYFVSLKVVFTCFILILIGYSTYSTIFIRASQHPRINENNPDNLSRALAYINRDQYGEINSLDVSSSIQSSSNGHWKRWTTDKNNITFKEKLGFRWNYQIKEMYLRYFAWQFIGRSDKEDKPWLINDLNNQPVGNRKLDGINFFRYGFPLALIFGLLGLFHHFNRDWKRALALLSIFMATGLLLVMYLNQYDPQPRERDYSYVGNFLIFSIWIGLGISFVQNKIKEFFEDSNIASFISITISCFIFILMTITMGAKDYKEHSRRGNFVAWDYGYNLLNSCEPNAIIFTNGDNDTFPLWYLQEVENIRKDVNVINLSLLNTPWYIEQLKNQNPTVDINFTNNALNQDIYTIESDYLLSTSEGYTICSGEFTGTIPWDFIDCELLVDNNIIFNFKVPSYREQVLRIQDYMILQIIKDLYNKRPIYFAATVSENNQVGLKDYLQMEGMTYRLVHQKITNDNISSINYNKMKLNLTQSSLQDTIKNIDDYNQALINNAGIYRYKNLNDEEIVFSDNIKRLIQNYRIGYLRMMQYQLSKNNTIEVKTLINQMNNYFPYDNLPIDPWLGFEIIDKIYKPLNDVENQRDMINHLADSNAETNVKLIAIIRSLELGHYDLSQELINNHIIKSKIDLDAKLALFFEVINSIGYLNSLDVLISDILNNHDMDALSINDKYALFGVLYQINKKEETIELGKSLLLNHYNSDLKDINTQKYIADILLESMDINSFIEFCNITFKNDKIEGMLYSLVNAYQINEEYDKALKELDMWIKLNPSNQRMINKRQKVLSNSSLQ